MCTFLFKIETVLIKKAPKYSSDKSFDKCNSIQKSSHLTMKHLKET